MIFEPIKTVKFRNSYNPEWVNLIITIIENYTRTRKMPNYMKKTLGDSVREVLKEENFIEKNNVLGLSWDRTMSDVYVSVYDITIEEIEYNKVSKAYRNAKGQLVLEIVGND